MNGSGTPHVTEAAGRPRAFRRWPRPLGAAAALAAAAALVLFWPRPIGSGDSDGEPGSGPGDAGPGLVAQDASPSTTTPTFNRDIAPIVFASCAHCHRPGEVAPFSLLTYHDVRKRRRQIVRVTESRFMPPFLPEPGLPTFVGERRLSAGQIALIRRWVETDAVEGDPADLPPLPRFAEGWQLGEPDLVVRPDVPFHVPADGTDVFRNFVIRVPIDRTRFVRAVELRPDNMRVIHHAIVQVDRTSASRRLDAADAEPGFPGMTMGRSQPPDGHFLGWTPGKLPAPAPEDMAWRLHPRSDLVLQLHMITTGKPELVRPAIGLFFTERAPERIPFSIVLFAEDIDIPAGAEDYLVRDRYVLPVDVEVLGIYPHAHYLCRTMQATAVLPDGTRQRLIRIGGWDFNWQDEYRYAEPFSLPAGTEIVMEYRYDNSAANERNPNDPPERVRFGQRSVDEMGTLTLQVLPADAAGRLELDKERWRHTLRKKSWDWDAYNNLACLLADEGSYQEAQRLLEAALQLKPDYADALCNLGRVLLALRQVDAAIDRFSACLLAEPDHVICHQNLAVALRTRGRVGEAMAHLHRAVEIDPDAVEARVHLGNALAGAGEADEAIREYRRALELSPGLPEAHNNLANTLFVEGRLDEAIVHYRLALASRPDYFNAQFNLARALVQQGEPAAAILHLEQAVRLRPEASEARSLLEQARNGAGGR